MCVGVGVSERVGVSRGGVEKGDYGRMGVQCGYVCVPVRVCAACSTPLECAAISL